MAVSPFDGSNRIRFKGSPRIGDLRLPIADWSLAREALRIIRIGNEQLAIANLLGLSALYGSPENFVDAVYYNSPSEFRGGSTRSVAMTLARLFKAGLSR